MRIALDAMGGDNAPSEVVKGAALAIDQGDIQVILVGNREKINGALVSHNLPMSERLHIVHASEVVEMDEHPASALRKKRDSSIVVAARLVAEGKADALVSMGNTGATMAASLLIIGRIPGVSRPALAVPMPTVRGFSLLLDCGATVDCKPANLLQFAVMGSICMEKVFGRDNPTVGLLNIGEEKSKGNELTRDAFALLSESSLNFVGNIEARAVPEGRVDVVVCDGFVGNILLKFAEGFGMGIMSMIRQEVMRSTLSKIGALSMKGVFRSIRKRMDYTEYGGVPLLGVNGVSIIGHGSSNEMAVANAIRVAAEAVEKNVVDGIGNNLEKSGVQNGQ